MKSVSLFTFKDWLAFLCLIFKSINYSLKYVSFQKEKNKGVHLCDIIITFYKPVSAELDGTAHVDVSDAGDNISDGGRKNWLRHFPHFFAAETEIPHS